MPSPVRTYRTAMTARSSPPTARCHSSTIATTNATTGAATPIMFPTFCAVEMRAGLSAMAVNCNHLVVGTSVLPRERRCVNGAQIARDLLVADHRLLAEGRHLPV